MARDRAIPILALAGLLARLVVIWTGLVEGGITADDAYYYFKIAANIAAGGGSTFDGLTLTNGYHPLWVWFLVPIFALPCGDLWLPVKFALTLATLCDLGTGLLLVGTLRTMGYGRHAWWTALFWYLSPPTLLIGLRGMEASLSALLVALVFRLLASVAAKDRHPRLGEAALVGGAVGLAGLARLDNLLVLGFTVVAFVLVSARQTTVARPAAWWRWLAAAGSVAAFVVLPWFWWNIAAFDSILPVSGQVKAHFGIYGSLVRDWHSPKELARFLTDVTVAPLFHAARFVCLEEFIGSRYTRLVTAGLVAAVLVPMIRHRKSWVGRLGSRSANRVLIAVGVFMGVHVGIMVLVWHAYVNWYALPYLALYSLILAVVVAPGQTGPSRTTRVPVALFAAFSLIVYTRFFATVDLGPAFGERWSGAELAAVAAAYPQGVQAGAFNAGTLGYIAPRFGNIRVVNLDGRVNNAAFAAARAGRLSHYIVENVEVLLEPPGTGYLYFQPGELEWIEAQYVQWEGLRVWSRAAATETLRDGADQPAN